MTVILTTATLANVTNLPVDEFVNSFVFQGASVPLTVGIAEPAVADFYNGTTGAGLSIASQLSAIVSRAIPVQLKSYDITAALNGSPHGTPVSMTTFVLAAGSSATGLPE